MNFEQKSLQEVIKDIGINVADVASYLQDPENGDKEAALSSLNIALSLVNEFMPIEAKVQYQVYSSQQGKYIMTTGDSFLDGYINEHKRRTRGY